MASKVASKAVVRYRTRTIRSRSHHKAKMTIPIAVIAGLAPTAIGLYNRRTSGTEMSRFMVQAWTGYDPTGRNFVPSTLSWGLLPALGGMAVHFLANRLGVNRAIARTGIPFIRI